MKIDLRTSLISKRFNALKKCFHTKCLVTEVLSNRNLFGFDKLKLV